MAGIVWDGTTIHDLDYQEANDVVSASWRGFSDPQSGVLYYMWGVGSSAGADDILSFTNVGVNLMARRKLANKMSTGKCRIYSIPI